MLFALLLWFAAADPDYQRGMALAQLERWDEARAAFESGRKNAPSDKRFPLELAGIDFKLKRFSEARKNLKQALRLDPGNRYANDFLATIYLLEENAEAALRYWNRIGKPYIEEVKMAPQPGVDPVLLDRAFAFSPASVLQLGDFQTTQSRLNFLGIFARYRMELVARPDEKFDLVLNANEKNGSRLDGLISLLSGVAYQTVYPDAFDLRHRAINAVSLVRWDAQKRRLFTALSGPLGQSASWRYRFHIDGRNENWETPARAFNLEKVEAGAEIESRAGGRWGWSSGVDMSRRRFRNLESRAAPLFADALALEYRARTDLWLVRIPERRFTLAAMASGRTGKMFGQPFRPFSQTEGGLEARWFPQARGDDYAMTGRWRAGKTFGRVPFDELFMLGLERDNDLGMHAHIGTRNGRKGSAPLGRDYVLFNWEADKRVYEHSFLKVKVGPLIDTGRIYDATGLFGAKQWLWDAGVQCKVVVWGGVGIVFSYARDLRSGSGAFYAMGLH